VYTAAVTKWARYTAEEIGLIGFWRVRDLLVDGLKHEVYINKTKLAVLH
jgi:hypothetical protein